MSYWTRNTDNAISYASERIKADHTQVLVIFSNGDLLLVAPIDSELPDGFSTLGTLYWDQETDSLSLNTVSNLD